MIVEKLSAFSFLKSLQPATNLNELSTNSNEYQWQKLDLLYITKKKYCGHHTVRKI